MDRGPEAGLPVLLEAGGRRARGRAAGGRHAGPGPGRGPAAGQSGGGADLRMRGDDLVHPGVVDANTVNDIQQVFGIHGEDMGRGEHTPAM